MSRPWNNWILSFSVLTVCLKIQQVESWPATESRLVLTEIPENTVALVGDTAVLKCSGHAPPPEIRIVWYERITDYFGRPVSNGEVIKPDHPNAARYRIIHSTPTEFYLEISNVQLSDGGRYQCIDEGAPDNNPPNLTSWTAELIVLDSYPFCNTTIPSHGEVLEGQTHTAECSVRFANLGGYNTPTMTWTGPPPFRLTETKSDNYVMSKIEFTVQRCRPELELKCMTNFKEVIFQFAPPERTALNAPTWEYLYTLNPASVYWPPLNFYIEPFKFKYTVGDILTCHTDASPTPMYQWLNTRTYETFYTQTMTITESMAGYNQTLLCQAQNVIGQAIYSGNIVANVQVSPSGKN